MSVIQYAVLQLKVQHIVVCGHYNCGGILAAMQGIDHGSPLENWLRNIRDVYRLHRDELDAIEDMDARARRLVELNVLEQATNLYKTYAVQQRRVETFKNKSLYGFVQPRIHPTVYEPATGELRPLDVEMKTILKDLAPIYGLYRSELGEGDETGEFEGMGPSYATP